MSIAVNSRVHYIKNYVSWTGVILQIEDGICCVRIDDTAAAGVERHHYVNLDEVQLFPSVDQKKWKAGNRVQYSILGVKHSGTVLSLSTKEGNDQVVYVERDGYATVADALNIDELAPVELTDAEIERHRFNDEELDGMSDYDYTARRRLITGGITKKEYLAIEYLLIDLRASKYILSDTAFEVLQEIISNQ